MLAIGIPTYNRGDAVVDRVRELLEFRDELGFRILVIDNASTDQTAERLTSEFAGRGVDILRNDENLGYAGNVLRLIEVTETEYLTIVSDEDQIERDGLIALIALLGDRHPRLVSPRAQVGNDNNYRGRRKTRQISPGEFEEASFYVSGLTFEVASAKRDAAIIAGLIPDNAAATYYPQVLLTALAILDGDSMFLDALVCRQVVQLQTRISDPGRGAYWFVPARWAQFEGFEEFFTATGERLPHATESIEAMRAKLRSGLFALIKSAAVSQFAELEGHVGAPAHIRLLRRLARMVRRG